jgi:pyrroline-5-carboxylate reductase
VKEIMVGTARILEGEQVTFDTITERVATKGDSTEEGAKVLQARLPEVMDEVLQALDAKRRVVSEKVAGG